MNASVSKVICDDLKNAHQTSLNLKQEEKASDVRKGRSVKSVEAFRSIGEAAEELGLKAHVLRFWETKFPQISPMKRKDRRRFYRAEDMLTLRAIQILLHERGMTIKGAQRYLSSAPVDELLSEGRSEMSSNVAGKSVRDLQDVVRTAVEGGAFKAVAEIESELPRERLDRLLQDLTGLKAKLDDVRKAS